MIPSIDSWFNMLRGADPIVCLPLLVGGAALMVFGWRLWRVCVVLSFGLIGGGLGNMFAPAGEHGTLYPMVGAVALGGLSYCLARHGIAVLGGIIGTGLAAAFLADYGLHGLLLWLVAAIAFTGVYAISVLHRQTVVIVVTALLGAGLLLSGLTVLAMMSPALLSAIRGMASGSAIVAPFVLAVPTVVSYFYQAGETRRLGVSL